MAYMGGLVATRSIGQFSTYYGGIEDLVCGMEVVLPDGDVTRIRPVPRRVPVPTCATSSSAARASWAS